jgi:hypothetical protein
VFCYSGGTEATALFYGSQNIGTSRIQVLSEGKTVYSIKYGDAHPIIGFSKT